MRLKDGNGSDGRRAATAAAAAAGDRSLHLVVDEGRSSKRDERNFQTTTGEPEKRRGSRTPHPLPLRLSLLPSLSLQRI